MQRVLDLFPVYLCDSRRAAALVAFDLLQPERARRRGPYNQNETSNASHHSRRSAHGGAHYRARAKAGTLVDPVPAGALTLAQASRLAEIGQLAFQALLAERRIPIHYGIEEFHDDLRTLRQMGGL